MVPWPYRIVQYTPCTEEATNKKKAVINYIECITMYLCATLKDTLKIQKYNSADVSKRARARTRSFAAQPNAISMQVEYTTTTAAMPPRRARLLHQF